MMKLLAIPEENRDNFRKTLATCSPEHLELSLIQLAQHPDDEGYNAAMDRWAAKHFPETLGKFTTL